MIRYLPHATSLTYYAEGGANVIYKIRIPSASTMEEIPPSEIDMYSAATPQPTELMPWEIDLQEETADAGEDEFAWLKGKLLRVRKEVPGITSVLEAQEDFEAHIAPLFDPSEVVSQSLVEIGPELREQLTAVLAMMDERGHRDEKRRDVYLADQDYGMVVTDMNARPESELVMVEFKPKWLAQSPSAPAKAKRCRNCATRALRDGKDETENVAGAFCPLDLVSGDESRAKNAVTKLIQGNPGLETYGERLVRPVTRYLTSVDSLLAKLKMLQLRLDPGGVFKADVHDVKFLAAMTLRDCTLFLRVNVNEGTVSEARLGDLDLKSPSKGERWRSHEKNLIERGWYEASTLSPGQNICGLQK